MKTLSKVGIEGAFLYKINIHPDQQEGQRQAPGWRGLTCRGWTETGGVWDKLGRQYKH